MSAHADLQPCLVTHGVPMLTYQMPHSPRRRLPRGTWGHSRERKRVDTHEPQPAVSGAEPFAQKH